MLLSGNNLRGIMIVNEMDRPCVGASERVLWLADSEMDRSKSWICVILNEQASDMGRSVDMY